MSEPRLVLSGSQAIRDSAGRMWILATTGGFNDPKGKGGVVHPELGGSGCRWVELVPGHEDESLDALEKARKWSRAQDGGGTL